MQRADRTGNLWNKLNGAGAGADHRHGLAPQVDFMPPAGRMKCWPRKRFEARQRRGFREVQAPHARDNNPRRDAAAAVKGEPPEPLRLVPLDRRHLCVQFDFCIEFVLLGHLFHIRQDFWLRGKRARPAGVLCE